MNLQRSTRQERCTQRLVNNNKNRRKQTIKLRTYNIYLTMESRTGCVIIIKKEKRGDLTGSGVPNAVMRYLCLW